MRRRNKRVCYARSAIRMGRSRASLMRVCSSPMRKSGQSGWISAVSMTPNILRISAVLCLYPAALPFSSKRKTESSKDWKASNNLYTRESKSAFLQYFFCGADERTGGNSGSDQERQTHTDGRCDPKIVATVGKKIQTKITTHRSPIQKVRFVESGNLTTRELIMAGQFVKQPGLERGCPGTKAGSRA